MKSGSFINKDIDELRKSATLNDPVDNSSRSQIHSSLEQSPKQAAKAKNVSLFTKLKYNPGSLGKRFGSK